jgi:hypothetical protein
LPDLGLDISQDNRSCNAGRFPNPAAFAAQANQGIGDMKSIRILIVTICMTSLSALAFAQSASSAPSATPPRVTPTDAKNYVGETVTVCGKVVANKTSKYGIAGRGKPVMFDIDQPEPSPVFYFVAFGASPTGPQEAIDAYQGKSVCVTGKISISANLPFIMADDRSKIKFQAAGK